MKERALGSGADGRQQQQGFNRACALLSKYFSSAAVNGRLSASTCAKRPLLMVSLLNPILSYSSPRLNLPVMTPADANRKRSRAVSRRAADAGTESRQCWPRSLREKAGEEKLVVASLRTDGAGEGEGIGDDLVSRHGHVVAAGSGHVHHRRHHGLVPRLRWTFIPSFEPTPAGIAD